MIREIVRDPLALQKKAEEATKDDLWIGTDLQDTLNFHRENCLGLAANMIGENKNIIIVSMGFIDLLMFNPTMISKESPYQTVESCLSLIGSRPTKRFERIKVTYFDARWKEKTLTLNGLAAQICQHEMDHLQGIVI